MTEPTESPDLKVPPKTVSVQLSRRQFGLAQTPESLPVLEAFQQFLDAERRRARNRMIGLTAFFLVLLVAVLGAAFYVGMFFFNQMGQDVSGVQADVQSLKNTADAVREDNEARVAGLSGETRQLRERAEAGTEALSELRIRIETGRTQFDEKLSGVQDIVSMLEVENASLKEELHNLDARWQGFVATARSATRGQEPHADVLAARDTTEDTSLVISLNVPGSTTSILWRMPIPE